MDRVVEEIIKRYKRYKKKLRSALPTPQLPLPSAFSLLPLLSLTLVSQVTFSASIPSDHLIPYYGKSFYDRVQAGEHDADLINDLRDILTKSHVRHQGAMDDIVDHCDTADRGCYSHTPVGYKSARKIIMGQLFLSGSASNYAVKDVYCEKDFSRQDFKQGPYPAPDTAPNETVINVEHTWPQSRFNPQMDNNVQKSDLHHLFPSDSELNRIRGNLKFGEVDNPAYALKCPQSKMGSIKGQGADFFEPPNSHKGNVARALFYFSVRYKIAIDPLEEGYLKKWNHEDPVDQAERDRNDAIQKMQGNRNPFVDFPELADAIKDF